MIQLRLTILVAAAVVLSVEAFRPAAFTTKNKMIVHHHHPLVLLSKQPGERAAKILVRAAAKESPPPTLDHPHGKSEVYPPKMMMMTFAAE
jgi:hypothetical protein